MKNHQYSCKEVHEEMEQNEFKGNKPDYKGSLHVAAWFNTDKDGNTYLSVVLGNRVKLLPNEQKLEDQFK